MKGIALIIGVKEYEYISSLNNTENDAVDISQFLEEVGFHVTTILNPTQRELIDAITKFKLEIKDGVVSIIYYAGHGIQLEGENYLVPKDANIDMTEQIPYFCFRVSDCLPREEYNLNSIHILILDACRNNPFKTGTRSSSRGLAKMSAPLGTLIAFSTGPGNTSIERTGERNGVYTHFLLKHLKVPNLSLEKIFKNTRTDVIAGTNGKQVPWEESSLHGEDYFFIKVPTALNIFIKKELFFAFKCLTQEEIELTLVEQGELRKEKVSFASAINLFRQQYEIHKNTIHPRDAFLLLFNLQKLIIITYKFIMITNNVNFKELEKMVVQHSKDLTDETIDLYHRVLLLMENYGSIFRFNDKFGEMKSITRTIENGYWKGFEIREEVLKNQNQIMEDLKYLKNNEIHLNEIINCTILIGVMNEFFDAE